MTSRRKARLRKKIEVDCEGKIVASCDLISHFIASWDAFSLYVICAGRHYFCTVLSFAYNSIQLSITSILSKDEFGLPGTALPLSVVCTKSCGGRQIIRIQQTDTGSKESLPDSISRV